MEAIAKGEQFCMEDSRKRAIGMPWYSRDHYPAIRDLMSDRHNLAPTYDQWLLAAENNEQVARQAGLEITRVAIEPAPFSRWCEENGKQPDSAARAAYVSEHVSGQGTMR